MNKPNKICSKKRIHTTGNIIIASILLISVFGLSTHDSHLVYSKSYNPNLREGTSEKSQSSVSNTATQTPSSTGDTTVIIPQGASIKGQLEKYYQPENITVSTGSQVTWKNEDITAHTATARNGSFDTGLFSAGKSASVTMEGQGKTDYYCTVHPWMTGMINIQT